LRWEWVFRTGRSAGASSSLPARWGATWSTYTERSASRRARRERERGWNRRAPPPVERGGGRGSAARAYRGHPRADARGGGTAPPARHHRDRSSHAGRARGGIEAGGRRYESQRHARSPDASRCNVEPAVRRRGRIWSSQGFPPNDHPRVFRLLAAVRGWSRWRGPSPARRTEGGRGAEASLAAGMLGSGAGGPRRARTRVPRTEHERRCIYFAPYTPAS
jgi:hypothetical protein